jgi:hypothetical protein
VNPFIYDLTEGRVYVSKVECREHEKNSAFIEVGKKTAHKQGKSATQILAKVGNWNNFVLPQEAVARYNE